MGNEKPNIKELVAYICAALIIYFWLSWHVFTNAQTPNPEPNWTQPRAITLKRVSGLLAAQSSTVAFPNIKCSLNDYRYSGDGNTYSGCFSDSAYGLFDVGNQALIFNGTDEALPILPFASHQTLVPWPGAEFLSVDPAPYSGSYLTLYTNPSAAMSDKRNLLFQLTAKQLISAPNLPIKDKGGQRLRTNSQTLAFSDNGAWMVVESEEQSFVRVNLSTLEIKPFTNNYVFNGNVNQPSHIAISDSGRYITIFNNPAGDFRVYDLDNCPITSKNLEPEYCPYFDYLGFVKKQVPTAISIKNISFINENLVSFEIIASKSEDSGIYELAPTDGIDNLMEYLGLGDSYTSGEGAFDYRSGTDTSENMCHLSANSYPLLITRDLYSNRGGNSVACSGAVIKDIGSQDETYKGQVKDALDLAHLKSGQPQLLESVMTNFVPGYVAQQRFVGQYTPKIVTVSIGGNDVGFGNMLESCVTAKATRHFSDNNCFSTYEDRSELINLVDRKAATWTKLFRDLKRKSPNSTFIALGYPQVADDQGSCGVNVLLSRIELEFSIEVINYINSTIQKSASEAGIGYIDIGDALDGHKLCQAKAYNIAVNGLTSGKDGGIFGVEVLGKESYHPNALGHRLIEQAILGKSKNFSLFLSQLATPDTTKLLNALKTGRKTYSRVPATITSKTFKKGRVAKISVKGIDLGTKPNTIYKIIIGNITSNPLTSTTSNTEGSLDLDINIPSNLQPGGQDIHIIGEGSGGENIDITQPVYIIDSDTDYDGDGVDNAQDSCPYLFNSGRDEDHDLIDDLCDPLIGSSDTGQTSDSEDNTSDVSTQVVTSVNLTPTSGSNSNYGNDTVLSGTTSTPHLATRQNYIHQQQISKTVPNTNKSLNPGKSVSVNPNKKQTFNEINGSKRGLNRWRLNFNFGLIKISLNFWGWIIILAWLVVFLVLYYREQNEQNTKYQIAR